MYVESCKKEAVAQSSHRGCRKHHTTSVSHPSPATIPAAIDTLLNRGASPGTQPQTFPDET